MRFFQMSGRFETAVNYPNNKAYANEFERLEKEIVNRLKG